MAFVFLNPNPSQNLTGDCVIRAISLAEDLSWEDTYIDLALEGFMLHDMPSANHVWANYLTKRGYKRYAVPNTCPNCFTVNTFALVNPKGIFILATGSHVVTVSDGNYFDTWDSGKEIPIYYFKKGEVNGVQ